MEQGGDPDVRTQGGRPLGARYLLFELIGAGSMSQVFRGTIREGDADLAIKVLRPELVARPEIVQRFMRERQALMSLGGDNVVPLLDLVVEGETLALVMPRMSGGTLREHLETSGGSLGVEEARDLIVDVLRGLGEAHAKGIIHRDIKPENILLERRGAGVVAKVSDFGIAAAVGTQSTSTASHGAMIGTAQYMAPELLDGAKATTAVDVYGAGILLYELVAGHPPFDGENLLGVLTRAAQAQPDRPEGLPDLLWAVLEAMVAKDPAQRPSADEAARRLTQSGTVFVDPSALRVAVVDHSGPSVPKEEAQDARSRELAEQDHQPQPQILATIEPPPPRPKRRWAVVTVVVIVIVMGGLGLLVYRLINQSPAAASELPSGAELQPGDSLTSSNGHWVVVMQGEDGNLVEYRGEAVGKLGGAVWDSRTSGHPGAYAKMQPHGGDLVIYPRGEGPPPPGSHHFNGIWVATFTSQPGSYAQLENNGAFVIRAPGSGSGNESGSGCTIWGTYPGPRCKIKQFP